MVVLNPPSHVHQVLKLLPHSLPDLTKAQERNECGGGLDRFASSDPRIKGGGVCGWWDERQKIGALFRSFVRFYFFVWMRWNEMDGNLPTDWVDRFC